MKRLAFTGTLTAILILAFSGCRPLGKNVQGSGVRKSEKRELGPFKSIQTSGAYSMAINCQQTQSVEIEGDDNVLPIIKTEVRSGVLHIDAENGYDSKQPVNIRINLPDLERFSSSGADLVLIANLKNEKLTLSLTGAGQMSVAGETKTVDITSNGVGAIDTSRLIAERAKVTVAGAGDVDVYANQQLDATVSGVGKVTYSGNPPVVNKSVSGVGSINNKQ